MTEKLSDERLAELRETAEASTPYLNVEHDGPHEPFVLTHDLEVRFPIARCADCGVEAGMEEADAVFFVQARETVLALLDELARWRGMAENESVVEATALAIAYTKPFEYKATARAGLAAAVETIKEQGCER